VFNLEEDDIEFYNLYKFSDFIINGDLNKLEQVLNLTKKKKKNMLNYYYFFWFESNGPFKKRLFKIQDKYKELYKPYNIFKY
jgi:hypothetical protein